MSLINQKINKIADIWTGLIKNDVFYLPILGPVYFFEGSIKRVLQDVLNNSQEADFLSYDKNKRWYKHKTEKILLESIVFNNKELFIPVKNNLKNDMLKIFYYTEGIIDDSRINKIRKMATGIKDDQINTPSLCCFKKPYTNIKFTCHNIYLKTIDNKDNLDQLPSGLEYYKNLSLKTQKTFNSFSKNPNLNGFNFLWESFLNQGKPFFPIVCAVEKGKIIGAIGPLDISKDAWNNLWLLPPYFGVKQKSRRKGYGKKLWQAAMNFSYQRGAKYTLVQNRPYSPAARFYEKQELIKVAKTYCFQI